MLELAGFNVHADWVGADKVTRAEPFAAQCEAGNVKLLRGAWNAAYLEELCDFPYGANDDQVDGSSGAFNRPVGGEVTVYRPKPMPNRWAEMGGHRRVPAWRQSVESMTG